MAGKSDKSQMHVSAGPSAPEEFFQSGPPPPSYEESLNINLTTPPQYAYLNPIQYQQQPPYFPPPTYATQGPSHASYGYANPYQTHIQQQQNFYNSSQPIAQVGNAKSAENVLYLTKGAKIRTSASGAIIIPPPPPGCAPTPGQLAAMSGQPVIIKKQKKSYF